MMRILAIVTLAVVVSLGAATAQAQRILIYDDNTSFGVAREAATRLGLAFTRTNAAAWATDMGMTWDLVIMDLPSNEPTGAWQTPLINHVSAGGRAIHTHWNPGTLGGIPAAFQVTTFSGHDTIPFYRWSGHPLYTSPQVVPDAITIIADIWGTNGFFLQPNAGGTAAAGFTMTPTANQAAIVIGNSGRTIFNGFLFDDYPGDADADGIRDIVELAMNEIAFVLNTGCTGRPDGTACTAGGLPGQCRAMACCTGCWNGASCVAGTAVTQCGRAGALCSSCADTNLCTTDTCAGGACSNPPAPAGTGCDDGAFCTEIDSCNGSGSCTGTMRSCVDGIACTADTCDEAGDRCSNPVVGACLIGAACVPAGTPDPSNPCRVCDPARSTTTYSATPAGSPCSDGIFCTAGDACNGSGTCTGAPRTCDDGLACTSDACDEAGMRCSNTTFSGCLIGGACVTEGTRNPANECESCQGGFSRISYSPVASGTACNDGAFCTTGDACNGSGTCTGAARSCNDGLACTTDACDEAADACTNTLGGGCVIGGACLASGAANPSNPCEVCDPARSTSAYSPAAAGTSCDDGAFCTMGDACNGSGTCAGSPMTCDDALACTADSCDEAGDACVNAVTTGCVIGGGCVAEGATDPGNACVSCQSAVSSTAYSPVAAGGACDDGQFCTTGDACDGAGTCATMPRDCTDTLSCTVDACDEAGDACTNVSDGSSCLIDGACVSAGTENAANPCEVCDPTMAGDAWTPVAAGELCGDPTCVDAVFTPAPTCDGAGTCVPGMSMPCEGAVCVDPTSCDGMCSDDTECLESHWCGTDMRCHPDLPNGDPCDRMAMCESDVCADGVCCADACTGTCASCTVAGFEGECHPYAVGSDPEEECEGAMVCDGEGMCIAIGDAGPPLIDAGTDDTEYEVRGSGCGCRAAGAGDATSFAWVVGILLGSLVLRRRRNGT